MQVLMIAPSYPPEMAFFTRALAEAGARVLGLGDGPAGSLDPVARRALSGYLQVPSLWDEAATVAAVRAWPLARGLERVECLWEPGVILAARLREALGLPGQDVAHAIPFRDKEAMKQVLDRAGIRTPRHHRARTEAEVREAAAALGYPLIVKPIAGAGSADTYRVDSPQRLEEVLGLVRHVAEVSVEEFIDGEEFTFDTICAGGHILFENVSWYRPRPLVARTHEWISSQTIALRDTHAPHLQGGIEMGRKVLAALGFGTGFTHMEWYLTARGEAVFGEIGGRAPGARSTDIMNYCCDDDVFAGWAEAVVHGTTRRPFHRLYNAAIVFKRAQGAGRIRRIEGAGRLRADFGRWLVAEDLLPVGAARRNWRQTLISDGWWVVRHPDLATCVAMADRIGTDLHLFASP
ncbi:MAG: acetyl-CoA carboxylase biotin carboxylase subunit family protein [Planctomycetia bacterium]